MSRLAATQRDFLAAILGEDSPSESGLAIYRRNVLGARLGALAAAHPVVRRLVGEAFFTQAAETYARAVPSSSGDLHAYGAGFARFLRAYGPARDLDYLHDVARLEWAVHESHCAADGVPFDFAALGRVPPEDLARIRIGLHPAVRLVSSEHPILAIWEANQGGRDGTPDRDAGPDRVVVRREGYRVAPVTASLGEWALLEACARGATLDEACAQDERARIALAGALARFAELGTFGGFEVAARP